MVWIQKLRERETQPYMHKKRQNMKKSGEVEDELIAMSSSIGGTSPVGVGWMGKAQTNKNDGG